MTHKHLFEDEFKGWFYWLQSIVHMFFDGFIVMLMNNWFLAPLTGVHVSLLPAIGVTLLVNYLIFSPADKGYLKFKLEKDIKSTRIDSLIGWVTSITFLFVAGIIELLIIIF